MSFLLQSFRGVRGVAMLTSAGRGVVPWSQNRASSPRTGPPEPSCSSGCTSPRVTTPNASRHSAGTTTARSPPRSENYSVPSAGRPSGSPNRENWSSWNVMISATFPSAMRTTSRVRGRYAPCAGSH